MTNPAPALNNKRKMVKIGTHSGSFHCDEALACWMLHRTAAFKDAEIVRSRDPEVLKDMDVVVDVGGAYEPASHRYDHHQRGFVSERHFFVLSPAGFSSFEPVCNIFFTLQFCISQ